jgi:precorrin-6B C5,15-methyltransferase / cobalt-precorrin-6B C5,C15-methyltransferase
MRRVTVIGCDGGPLPAAGRAAIAAATLIAGGDRHLSQVELSQVETDVRRIVMGPVAPAVAAIAAHDGPAVVLASGDPGFFGIVRALRQAGIDPTVLPAVSSVATAFARAGLPWDDALVVSAHGRELRRAANVCRAYPKVAVLTAPAAGPAELGTALAGVRRTFVVAERLGTPDEQVVTVDAAQAATRTWADPNVVLVLDPDRPPSDGPGWIAGRTPVTQRWALPESAYAHRDSMITKAEVRAYAVARLGPRLGDLIWDVGAGSGSVAAECATLGAAVIAVDRDPRTLPHLEANTAGLGVQIVAATAPDCLAQLPDPDAVFVGGGGLPVLAACAARRPHRIVTALAAIERVGPAMAQLTAAGYQVDGVQLQASRFAPLPDGSHRLAATNPVHLISGELL